MSYQCSTAVLPKGPHGNNSDSHLYEDGHFHNEADE